MSKMERILNWVITIATAILAGLQSLGGLS
jgi:hypothetical protein